jgi:hypothetical protein
MVSSGLMVLLGKMDVAVLGCHVLPEQAPADQARQQYEERAVSALNDLVEEFQMAGGSADSRLVFTHDREQTVSRVADETDSRAIAVSGATGNVDRILVSLSGDVVTDRILTFVQELIGDRDIDVTLLSAGTDEAESGNRLERVARRLSDSGTTVQIKSIADTAPFKALVNAVPGHDAVVIGEKAPSRSSLFSSDDARRTASAVASPVLIVRYDQNLDG